MFLSLLASTLGMYAQNSSKLDPDGTVHVTRTVPVAAAVSDEAKTYMARPVHPGAPDVEANRKAADGWQQQMVRDGQALYPAKMTEAQIAGVPVRVFEPAEIPADHRERVLINLHGGGFQADWGSVVEAMPLASLAKTKVVAVRYRLAPEHPFPAAVDDALAVYKEMLKQYKPEHIAVYGTSAGAILTAELAARLQHDHLPLPAALGIFSGLGDYARPGESLYVYGLDGFKATPDAANSLDPYVGRTDKRDPLLSPEYSDAKGLPPTLFLTSTPDLLLSGTCSLQRHYLQGGVDARLVVFEGLPHAFWNEYHLPESREAYGYMVRFFEEQFGKK